MDKRKKSIVILGVKYSIEYKSEEQDEYLQGKYGYCDLDLKKIVINNKFNDNFIKTTLRHELLHAFMYECGLHDNSLHYEVAWATNEEMIDFFSIQWVKLNKIFEQLEVNT